MTTHGGDRLLVRAVRFELTNGLGSRVQIPSRALCHWHSIKSRRGVGASANRAKMPQHGRQPQSHSAPFEVRLRWLHGGYRPFAAKNTVSLAFCWSHVCRRFYELAAARPAPIATEPLRRIAELYRSEDEIRGRTQDDRCAIRQDREYRVQTSKIMIDIATLNRLVAG
ncbi:insertion sequence transposase protein [Rhizobium rhizogenes K84]|uniref:Insertion sequence transposase protein n=1 Tax=Rhizobium rhizogenes (strain K84 / ATCC BAA-868) TaxID=311403 RepID=B9JNE9_RHIR8|nr:insertion sequence transposase protein [Rhizobium rhizogenes K84]